MFLFLHVQAGSVQIASRVYNIQVVTPGELVEERSLRFCRPDARQAIGGCGVERSRLSLGSKVQTNLDTIPICLWINGTKIGMVSCSFVCLYSLCIFFFGIIILQACTYWWCHFTNMRMRGTRTLQLFSLRRNYFFCVKKDKRKVLWLFIQR